MKPNATIATGLVFVLLAGPAAAQSQAPPGSAQAQSLQAENLERIRQAVNAEPKLRIENGQLRIYVEVIGNWPSFASNLNGYDLMNGPTGHFGKGNPMSHAEFVAMSTPRDLYSSAGIKPAEVVTMAAVNLVGQWALAKALTKWSNSRKDKELKDIRSQIDAELAALAAVKKEKDKDK